MTDITPTTATSGTAATTSAQSARSNTIASDFDTFLTLLTAQIQNQDPLNPIDSTEYATQLATFSSVEQQVQTNDLLTALLSQNAASSMAQMAGWIGSEVRVAASAYFDGSPVTVAPQPPSHAARAELVAYDSLGNEKSRVEIPVSDQTVAWDGQVGNGSLLQSGTYSFEVIAYDSTGQVIDRSQPQIYAAVTEARSSDTGIQLILTGGISVDVDDVTAVRAGT
ncbi:flagellar hook capping FlgD N-terminal domain-containing protein [Tropicimonas sp.]|uniref:flagellar hook capping FlgD N-terminal domain-containing protein n=1 Tax=Tropicimonas sp. TaxID=2067044 RepID=UPI003A8A8872